MNHRAGSAVSRVGSPELPRARDVLDAGQLERLAELVAEKLDERQRSRWGWVGADVVASYLGVDRETVYEQAQALGARRLGDGPRARLRFRLDLVDEALDAGTSLPGGRSPGGAAGRTVERKRGRRQGALSGTGAPLLPVRGHETP